jgi:hypothetical protein
MKRITIFVTALFVMAGLLLLPSQTGGALAQSPGCTPSPAAGCPTDTPEPTETRNPTRTPTPTSLPLTLPSPTPTPLPFSSGGDPLWDPPRPTGVVFGYPTFTPTPQTLLGPPPIDLEIWALEITQGIQNLENQMPLVEDRWTVVRVYVRTDGGTMHGVRGFLAAFRGGQQVGGTISSENQPISASETGGERVNLDDSLYFYIPDSWMKEGTVTFKAFVYGGAVQNVNAEPEKANNYFEETVDVQQPTSYGLVLYSMHNHLFINQSLASPLNFDYFCIIIGCWNVVNNAYRLSPVSEVDWQIGGYLQPDAHTVDPNFGLHGGDWDLSGPTGWVEETAMLSEIKADWPNAGDQFYGMLDPGLTLCLWDGEGNLISCNFGGFSNGDTAIGEMRDSPSATTPWFHDGGAILMHEVGHNLGLGHYDCAGNEASGGGIDPNAPFTSANCSLAPVDPEGYYGFDVYWAAFSNTTGPTVISNDPAAAQPNQGFPLMGYKAFQYVDAYSYCFMLNTLGISCNPGSIGIMGANPGRTVASRRPANPPAALQAAAEHILLIGGVDTAGNTADFYAVQRLANPTAAQLETASRNQADVIAAMQAGTLSGYQITFTGAGGETLAAAPLLDRSNPHEPTGIFGFSEILAFPAGTAAIHLTAPSGEHLVTRLVTAPPSVTILSPNDGGAATAPLEIRWEASDPDGDPLTYSLAYSPDNGATWYPIAAQLTATSVIFEHFDLLAGSAQGLFRVTALDGVNAASDVTDAPLTIPDGAPNIILASPTANRAYPLNATVILSGSASDREDGMLGSDALTWSSDLDGALGSGKLLLLNTLSPGLHTITLTATDSAGNTSSALTYVNIDPNVSREQVSAEELQAGTDALNGILPEPEGTAGDPGAAASETAPASPEAEPAPAGDASSGGIPAPVWLIGGGLLVVIVLILLMRTRRKS